VMARSPFTISLIRRAGTPMSFASRYWLKPIGLRKSSSRISPGVMFASSLLFIRFLMVIHYFNLVCAGFPAETYPPLIINADAMLSNASTFQGFQPIAWRHRHVQQLCGGVEL